MNKVKFAHVCLAGSVMSAVATIAFTLGHMPQGAFIPTLGSIVGTVILSPLMAGFE